MFLIIFYRPPLVFHKFILISYTKKCVNQAAFFPILTAYFDIIYSSGICDRNDYICHKIH